MFEALPSRFGSPEAVFGRSTDELCAIPRLTPIIANAIRETDVDAINAELAALEQEGITVRTFDDITYPSNLRSIPTPPPILFEFGASSDTDAGDNHWKMQLLPQLMLGLTPCGSKLLV